MTQQLIIAGNATEAYDYINRKIAERISQGETVSKINDYVYVHSREVILGKADPHGVFVGSWRERRDILEIVEALYNHSRDSHRLREIHNQLYYEHLKRTAVK